MAAGPAHAPRPPKTAWITAGTHLGIPADGAFRIGRRREQVAANYILFSASPEESVTLADPPAIAFAAAPGQLETWTSDPFAADLRTLLLGQARGRGLRTTNRQQPHRHIRLGNPVLLRAQLNQLTKEHGLAARQDLPRT